MAERIHPAVSAEIRRLEAQNEAAQAQIKALQAMMENLERRDVHLDDMPGKQLPYKYQINIPLTAGTQAATTGTVTTSRDGPFVARRLYASLLITDAPTSPTDHSAMIGRFSPINSRDDLQYQFWSPTVHADLTNYIAPLLDWEFAYSDGGSDRNRQDKPISGDILAKHDEDGYMMNNEIFAAGTTISFTVYPLRAVEDDFDIMLKITFDGFKVLQPLSM
jgi:hypothetical protein